MDDLLSEFLTETNESVALLDSELIDLEQNPNNPGLIDNIFRLVHTIKGTCGFLGLPRLEALAHSAENVFGKFRDGEMQVTPEAVTLILASFDRIKDLLSELEARETEPEGDDQDLIVRLNAMASGHAAPADTAPAQPEPVPELVQNDVAPPKPLVGEVSLEELEAAFLAAPGPEDLEPAETGPAETGPVETEAATEASGEEEDEDEESEAEPLPEPVASAPPKEKPAAAKESRKNDSNISNQSIRVNVQLLENLMTMVSELVLSRNQLLQMVRGQEDSEFHVPLQRLSHVTTELQEGVMKTRMQPIGNAWSKLPRIVRDLSLELDKKIDLQMEGAETELDRQVLELIKDPLTHMVRNSADHGLETTAERIKAGKPKIGKIILNAYHEGGHINITISDDGKGLAADRIKQKALEKGLVSTADAETMSEQRIHQFIFMAGFSTAEKVTAVSGRGVGMDVVRTNIEKIGGTVEVKSEIGKGTVFIIKIPLTLAIVSALIVECAEERFAIPQLSVIELVRASYDGEHRIEKINGTPVLRLRERLLPLVFLDKALGLRSTNVFEASEEEEQMEWGRKEAFVVVSKVGNYNFGIVVDQVFDTEEIVVKPVAPILRDVKLYSGNTILGDGSVIMILDPNGVSSEYGGANLGEENEIVDERRSARGDDLLALLVFKANGDEPKAVPLSLVARLEEFDVSAIEQVNSQLMVQYRGKLMPLVKVNPDYQLRQEGRQPVLVFADTERTMGLVVDEIVDIVEETLHIEVASTEPGLLGSAIVSGCATEIVDVAHFLAEAHGDWFSAGSDVPFGEAGKARSVLLVDDSAFFRNMMAPLLGVAGYEVTTVDSADKALELRDSGESFDIIISDIEMPGMNGFDFATAVRGDNRWKQTPIVAMSSHTAAKDFDRGREVGFTDYVAKNDREALLEALSNSITMVRGAA